jgi:RND family efflux transporter MFP subunit
MWESRTLRLAVAALAFAAANPGWGQGAAAQPLASAPVRVAAGARTVSYDGSVEAVRQTALAAQVAGAVIGLEAKAGDAVRAGQTLVRLDARTAEQSAVANDAQTQAARAALEVATRELERQRQLFQNDYISRAALERAEAQYKSTRAQLDAQLAQAGAARTQTGLHAVKAPYAGVVAEVPVSLGDMALPGRPLLTLYDPSALRVSVALPQTLAARGIDPRSVRLEIPGLPGAASVAPVRVTVLPTVDAATHTALVRLDLPADLAGARPGQFARVWLADSGVPAGTVPAPRLYVPAGAVVRRAELTAVYVIDEKQRPVLRQVRLGPPAANGEVEVLAGISAGERVALDPQAAARVR